MRLAEKSAMRENLKRKMTNVIRLLLKAYPHARIALRFSTPIELLVATVLSAQCTDNRVNGITRSLFEKYTTVTAYADADRRKFEQEIRSAGFFRNKAKNIIAAAQMVRERYKGKVPDTMKELLQLPGVARKTANIILYNSYGKNEGIAVDTHVRRVSRRLGVTHNHDPVKIERDLLPLVPIAQWGRINLLLIEHGRAVCKARKPHCGCCILSARCDYYALSAEQASRARSGGMPGVFKGTAFL
jgi:endonuclease-3